MASRTPRTLLVALIPLLLLASTAAAQTVGKSQIIGWAYTGTTSEVHIQDIDNNCPPAKSLFKILGAPFTFWGGGTAYDPRHESLRLVALTGYGAARDRQAVKAAGFDDHLVKPLRREDLVRVLPRTGGDAEE